MEFGRWAARAGALLVLALAGLRPAHAAILHDAGLDWQTLTTAHFAVHFHQGGEARAREVAAIAEQVHARLAPVFHWSPADRTDIVVTDEYDVSNGFTTFFPSNRIELYLAPPDSLNTLEDHAGWLETVITHEYAHVLHLDKARGAPGVLRRIFGRLPLFFPNALEPAWLIEGMAVYYETDLARGIGRGQSSLYDMYMRMEVDGGIKPLRQVNQEVDTWPNGTVPYLYGIQFMNFAAQRYGAERVQRWVENYSDNIIPFRIISNSRAAFGRDLDQAWNEFAEDRQAHYGAATAAIRARGERAGTRLTTSGYDAAHARGLPDGTLFWTVFDGRNEPALMVRRPGGAIERLSTLHYDARIDVHTTAGVLVAQPERCGAARLHYDLYRVDATDGTTRRLTRCARYRSAAWSPDATRIAAVHHEMGHSRLDLLDAEGALLETLWRGDGDDTPTELDWSPDGASIAAAVWRPGSGWNIERFMLAEKRWQALTHDAAIDAQPRFTRDGAAILFSSDHGGVYNIRRLSLADGHLETLTNVVGGAFYPTTAEAGSLYYIGYGAAGFDVYTLLAPVAAPTPVAAPGASGLVQAVPPLAEISPVEPYSPWSGLAPRWWLPHLVAEPGRTEIGGTTTGWDTLGRHMYALDLAYDVDNGETVGAVDYIYDRWWPIFKLGMSRYNLIERDDETVTRLRHSDALLAEVVLPWITYDWRWSVHAGAVKERESDALVEHGALPRPEEHDALAGLALVFDSTRQFPLSVSRSHGREVRLVAEDSDAFTSDYRGKVYSFDWREFLPLGGGHVLALRYAAGRGDDGARRFELGGSRGASPAPLLLASPWLDTPFNVRRYGLRGYPEGLAALSGFNMETGTIEWRFPIERVERGIMTPPMALQQLSAGVFVDAGRAWDADKNAAPVRTGAGIEVSADVTLFYFMRFDLRAGYAHGFDDGGEDQLYLRLGAAF